MRVPLILPLVQFLIISLPYISIDATQLVAYDTEGNELSSDFVYYVLPADRAGGGLIATPYGSLCLHLVSQERNEALLGTAVIFTPRNASVGTAIRLSSDVFIEFNDLSSFCVDRLDWHLISKPPQQYVAAGNEDGVRHFAVFRVEKHDANTMGYKLMSCADKGPCKDIGLLADKDKTWLTVSNKPYMVVFRKA